MHLSQFGFRKTVTSHNPSIYTNIACLILCFLFWIFIFELEIMIKGPGLYSDIGKKARVRMEMYMRFCSSIYAPVYCVWICIYGFCSSIYAYSVVQCMRSFWMCRCDFVVRSRYTSVCICMLSLSMCRRDFVVRCMYFFCVYMNMCIRFHSLIYAYQRMYLLYKDYQGDQKFTVTTYSPTGVAITSSGTKKGELFLGDVNTQLKRNNITTDINVDTNSNLFTAITIDEPVPGLKTIISFKVPDQSSGKVELQYLHDYAGICASVGGCANPIVSFSGVVGTNSGSIGADVSFDTKTGNFIKYNAGLSLSNADLIASLTM
ncbi:putative Porin domain superfamily, eukaryotic porin/Tom40 [Helianthus annuus]|nr:putative Porin domain superfamily, eukaryotic porin/Tom40 [Helianthus annuus]